ncbi:hypothetical protein BH24CHL7_BH24CHL7_15560 [soil metagenome]
MAIAVGVAGVCGVVVAVAVGVAVAGGVEASVAVALGTAGVVAEVVGARLDVELCSPGVRVGAVPDGVLAGWSDTQATTRERINIGAIRRMNLTRFLLVMKIRAIRPTDWPVGLAPRGPLAVNSY